MTFKAVVVEGDQCDVIVAADFLFQSPGRVATVSTGSGKRAYESGDGD